MKRVRKVLALGLIFILILQQSGICGGVSVKAADPQDGLGKFSRYNGIIFDKFVSYQADTEGALAVGGDGSFGIQYNGYDIGAAGPTHYSPYAMIGQYEKDGFPTLLLNGNNLILGNGNNAWGNYGVYDGDLVMNSTLYSSYQGMTSKFSITGGELRKDEDAALDEWFETAQRRFTNASNRLPDLNRSQTVTIENLGKQKVTSGNYSNSVVEYQTSDGTLNRVLNINITSDASATLNGGWEKTINLDYSYINSFDGVVFNFLDAVDVNFSGAILVDDMVFNVNTPAAVNKEIYEKLSQMAEKMIWNFPKAESIRMTYFGMIGSVIAPKAKLTANGGSINGMLVSEAFESQNGMELHAFRLNKRLGKEIDETPDKNIDDRVGTLEIHKKDKDTGRMLSGAKFDLEKKDDRDNYILYETLVTDKVGMCFVDELPQGEYRLIEIEAPSGYAANNPAIVKEFEIKAEQQTHNHVIEIENALLTIDLKLLKIDEAEQPLAGADFILYKVLSNGKYQEIKVNKNGATFLANGLTAGDYLLKEVQTPTGYQIPYQEYQFTVQMNSEGELEVVYDGGILQSDQPIRIKNITVDDGEVTPIHLTIHKVDQDDKDRPLEGAKFNLSKVDNGASTLFKSGLTTSEYGVIFLTSDDDAIESNQRYRLEETDPPEGYELDPDPVDFIIKQEQDEEPKLFIFDNITDESGQYADSLVIVKENEKEPEPPKPEYEVEVIKVDSEDDNKKLSGAGFNLYQVNDVADDFDITNIPPEDIDADKWNIEKINDALIVTGDDGTAKVTGLTSGYYVLLESKVPDGYAFEEELKDRAVIFQIKQKFDGTTVLKLTDGTEVNFANDKVPIIIENDPILGKVRIIKFDASTLLAEDSGPTYLADAKFKIEQVDDDNTVLPGGVEINSITSVGNEQGVLIENLPYGRYRLVEVEAPSGYNSAFMEENGVSVSCYFEIDEHDDEIFLYVPNYPIPVATNIMVHKMDAETNEELEDAGFVLWEITYPSREIIRQQDSLDEYLKEGNIVNFNTVRSDLVTDEDGNLEIDELTSGVYALFEHSAPEAEPEPYLYTVPEWGQDSLINQIDDEWLKEVYNYTITFEIDEKSDPQGGVVQPLDSPDPELEIRWVDKNKIATGSVVLDQDNNTIGTKFNVTNIKEEDVKKGIKIRKLDDKGTTGLAGAVFTLEKLENDEWKPCPTSNNEFTTQSDGMVSVDDLLKGYYRLIEKKAPSGYKLNSTPIEFELRANANTRSLDLYMDGELVTEGAVIEVTNGNANKLEKDIIIEVTNDRNGGGTSRPNPDPDPDPDATTSTEPDPDATTSTEPDPGVDPNEDPDPGSDPDEEDSASSVPGGSNSNGSGSNKGSGSDFLFDDKFGGNGKYPPLTGVYRDVKYSLMLFSVAGMFISAAGIFRLLMKRRE